MNEANRCYLSIQESPAASHDPDITNVDGVVPNTSRERGGLGRRRRHEHEIERRQQTPMDREWPSTPIAADPRRIHTFVVAAWIYAITSISWIYVHASNAGLLYNTPSPYDPMTSTPSAPARWDRETVSPRVDFYDVAGTSAPQIDLNTQLFDESNYHNDNQDARRNPHRGARDRHWRCGT
ncbi:hypothetical protein RIF29_25148 [Crotalaria pallida]|uniref:Uncharacterized protein n=1 Tax=Crotalaria pallida TaxID=3830 RepID=A0AAN9HZI9_CROPI